MEEKCTVLLNDIVYHNVAENADCNPVSMQVLTSTNFASHLKNQLDTCDGFGERLLKIGKITLSENSYLWNNETRLSLERINRTFNRNLLATIEKCAGIFYNASAGLLEAQSCDFEGDFSRLCSVERNMTIAGRQGGRQGGSQGGKLDKFEGGIKDGLNIIKDIPGAGYAIDSAKKTVGDWIFGMGEKKTKDVTIDLALQNVFWMVLAMLSMFVVCGCFSCALCGPNVKRFHGQDKVEMRDQCCPDMDTFELAQPSDEKIPV